MAQEVYKRCWKSICFPIQNKQPLMLFLFFLIMWKFGKCYWFKCNTIHMRYRHISTLKKTQTYANIITSLNMHPPPPLKHQRYSLECNNSKNCKKRCSSPFLSVSLWSSFSALPSQCATMMQSSLSGKWTLLCCSPTSPWRYIHI